MDCLLEAEKSIRCWQGTKTWQGEPRSTGDSNQHSQGSITHSISGVVTAFQTRLRSVKSPSTHPSEHFCLNASCGLHVVSNGCFQLSWLSSPLPVLFPENPQGCHFWAAGIGYFTNKVQGISWNFNNTRMIPTRQAIRKDDKGKSPNTHKDRKRMRLHQKLLFSLSERQREPRRMMLSLNSDPTTYCLESLTVLCLHVHVYKIEVDQHLPHKLLQDLRGCVLKCLLSYLTICKQLQASLLCDLYFKIHKFITINTFQIQRHILH